MIFSSSLLSIPIEYGKFSRKSMPSIVIDKNDLEQENNTYFWKRSFIVHPLAKKQEKGC